MLITSVIGFLNGTKSFLPVGKRATVKKRRTDGTFGTAYRYRPHAGLKALKPCECDCRFGFDAGNGRDYHAITESRTPDVVNVPSKTNVGIPGMMVFKLSNVVDGGESGRNDTGIILPGSQS